MYINVKKKMDILIFNLLVIFYFFLVYLFFTHKICQKSLFFSHFYMGYINKIFLQKQNLKHLIIIN